MAKKLTLKDMQSIAESMGGKCLSKEYINAKTKLEWQCEKGHKWWSKPKDVLYTNSWCSECSHLSRKAEVFQRICKLCGKEFFKTQYKISKGEGKFCSKKCFNLWRVGKTYRSYPDKIERTCLVCGKLFKITPSVTRKENSGKYCSKKCHNQSMWGKRKDAWVELKCSGCSKLFVAPKHKAKEAKFCSIGCQKTRVEKKCENCGKIFWVEPNRLKDKRGKYCSTICYIKVKRKNYKKQIDSNDVVNLYLNEKLNGWEIAKIYGCPPALIYKTIREAGFTIRDQSECGKLSMRKPERIEANRKAILKQYASGAFPRQTNTRPERIIKEELIKLGLKEGEDFIHQYTLNNKFRVDFYFPKRNLIVECDGDYWHANPVKHAGKSLRTAQVRTLKLDNAKNAYIGTIDDGSWKLMRLWETDINKNAKKCVDIIMNALTSSNYVNNS